MFAGWFTRTTAPSPKNVTAPEPCSDPACRCRAAADPDPGSDRTRAAALRLTREDAGTPPMATVPAAATVPPMPGWNPNSTFGMCRET